MRSEQMLGMLASSSRRDRGDDTLLSPERVGSSRSSGSWVVAKDEVEFGLQFLPPLPDERGRRQHQHALSHAAQHIFLEDHAGLDGLAEADLVGEQHTAAELLQDLSHGFDLMPERFDAGEMGQAEQFVETLSQAEMGETFAQPPPSAVPFGHMRNRVEQGRKVKLGRKGDVDFDSRKDWSELAATLATDGVGLLEGRCGTRGGCGFDVSLCRHRLASLRRGPVAIHDLVDLPHHPSHAFPSAGENLERGMPLGQFVAFQ